jgi:hypothetical protein
VCEQEHNIKTIKGTWDKFIVGDLRRETFDTLLQSMELIWKENITWDHNNVVLAYPIALPEAYAKTVALAPSHIILREAEPKEILSWIISLWERKRELYGDENVGSVIAINVQFVFHVKDAKRVFYDSRIREIGQVPTNIQTEPKQYFEGSKRRTSEHLFFLQKKHIENPIQKFVEAAEMVVFSFGTQTFAEICERGEDILITEFGIKPKSFKIVRAAANDPTKKERHTAGATTRYLQFLANNMKYMFNVSNGQLFVFYGKDHTQLASYFLWKGDLQEANLLKANLPKNIRTGEFILDKVNEIWHNIKDNRFIKPFTFNTIKKNTRFIQRPHKEGWDFAAVDFEMFHTYTDDQNRAAELTLFAAGIHWRPLFFNVDNYEELKEEWISKYIKQNNSPDYFVGRNQATEQWHKHAIENHIIEVGERQNKLFMFDPLLEKAPHESVNETQNAIIHLEHADEAYFELPKQTKQNKKNNNNQLIPVEPIIWGAIFFKVPNLYSLNIQQRLRIIRALETCFRETITTIKENFVYD